MPRGEFVAVFAHLSDLHATPPSWGRLGEVTPKRVLGRLSWQRRRRFEHRPEILEALLADLAETRPERVVVTGDVTNQGLASEHRDGAAWLQRLGGPERVFLVPGNHDVYVPDSERSMREHWQPFLAGDTDRPGALPVRVHAGTAFVGVNSGFATPATFATGRVGARALDELDRTLAELGAQGLRRVVLLHHPPWTKGIARRRALADASALAACLARRGAELALHGHMHRTIHRSLDGPAGEIPVVGVASASAAGLRHRERRARYHLIEARDEGGFRLRARVWDPEPRAFVEGEGRLLGAP